MPKGKIILTKKLETDIRKSLIDAGKKTGTNLFTAKLPKTRKRKVKLGNKTAIIR